MEAFKNAVTIRRTPEEVFTFLADFENVPPLTDRAYPGSPRMCSCGNAADASTPPTVRRSPWPRASAGATIPR